ncbi:SNF-related serine/threonine-protein kinase [Phytophthora citrophthora]|uniref:SNF-related serine/threonine-protein kinase n=1 Tax=Phytophthora citrophthora TaxID=4793 RepID=A0AAD9LB38_9STRA|nr:SNF-related serine/threonine-protein kinase [Phytophthora citrophthora]
MEVLVIAATTGTDALFDAVLNVLQTSSTPIEVLKGFPVSSTELQDHQLIVSRKRMDRDSLSVFIKSERKSVRASEDAVSSPTGPPEAHDASHLLRKIGRKSKKIKLLSEQVDSFRAKAEDAMQKAQHLEMEQEQFFDDVSEMKAQYDKLADNHRKLMWEYLPARDPSLRAIPRLTAQLPETPTEVGKYPLDHVLGYGQYAVVYTSHTPERPELAIKAIDKQKLMDLVSLHRISSEIASLSDPAIRHPGILNLVDVIHTHKHVYLVTERGGKDLFEFFGAHTDGVEENTIHPLMLHLVQAVEVLHRNNYCHRDLKPENVLYAPEDPHLIKLIDFGLCTKATTEQGRALHDFCGSPGFFAPELLLHDNYDGCKADVWSIGCILLELVLGNSVFSSLWMSMYDISILKEPKKFAESVKTVTNFCFVGHLPFTNNQHASLQVSAQIQSFCHGPEWKYSDKLRSVLLGMLSENPSERFSIKQVLNHPWLLPESSQAHSGSHSAPRRLSSPSHSTSKRGSSPVKKLSNHGPTLSAGTGTNAALTMHPLPVSPAPLVSSAPGTPHSHHRLHSPSTGSLAKLSLPTLSPEKPSSRCSPERRGTPDKLAFSVTRV